MAQLRLAPRFGIAIVLTVAAAYLLDQALRTLLPPQPFLIVQRAWLIDNVAAGVAGCRTASHAACVRHADALPAAEQLNFAVTRESPSPDATTPSHLKNQLATSIADAAKVDPRKVFVAGQVFNENHFENAVGTVVAIIPDLPALLTVETLATRESSVLVNVSIVIEARDGLWLTITPRPDAVPLRHYARLAFSVIGNLLIICFFSFWLARSVINPLRRLTLAAERMGREREPLLITGMSLPEYAAIAQTFNTMQLRIKGYIDERMQMLAAISHDLRTPLTRLRLLAEYLPDPAQQEQLLSNIGEMETMVLDALALMSEQLHREQPANVNLAATLISLCDSYKDLGESVDYDGPDHLHLICRPVALKRAFANLIANGCKYGGSAHVTLRRADGHLLVDVRDRGPGIPADQTDLALTPFQRLEKSRSRETGGTGLGLSIADEIIRNHGGALSFLHLPAGFTVRVRLPVAPQTD